MVVQLVLSAWVVDSIQKMELIWKLRAEPQEARLVLAQTAERIMRLMARGAELEPV